MLRHLTELDGMEPPERGEGTDFPNMWNFFCRKAGNGGEPLWCVSGAAAVLYAAIGGYFVYATIRYLTAGQGGDYMSLFWFIHGPIHEIGHFLFPSGRFPLTIHLLAGTIFQVLAPVAGAVQFAWRREYPPLAVMLGWLGFAVLDTSIYMADARRLEHTLVSPFAGEGETIHDWNWLFDRFGCLNHAEGIASCVAFFGYLCCFLSVFGIAYMVLRGFRRPRPAGAGDDAV